MTTDMEITEPMATERGSPRATLHGFLNSRWATLALLMTGTFVVALDFFIVNVAVPSIERGLRAGPSEIEWIVASYGLTSAVALITAGRLGDAFGRRRALMLGFALFGAASAVCGAAPNASVLVAGRAIQGLGGALLSGNVLSTIGVTFAGRDRARAISVFGIVMGFAGVGGQFIGGALIAANPAGLSWRLVFLINVPITAIALALAPRLVKESRAGHRVGFDSGGVAILTTGLAMLVLPLIEGRRYGWPVWMLTILASAPIVLALFGLYEHRLSRSGRTPLLDLALFRQRAFTTGLIAQLAVGCGQASFFLVLALYLQNGRGLSPAQSGLVFMFLATGYLAASLRAPQLTLRYGRRVVGIGAVTLACGHTALLLAVNHVGTGGSSAILIPGLVLVGAGMGLCITPLTTIVLSAIDPHRAGAIGGTLSTTLQVGNSLGVAIIGVIFFDSLHHGIAHAFVLSLVELACLLLAVAGLSRLLPAKIQQNAVEATRGSTGQVGADHLAVDVPSEAV